MIHRPSGGRCPKNSYAERRRRRIVVANTNGGVRNPGVVERSTKGPRHLRPRFHGHILAVRRTYKLSIAAPRQSHAARRPGVGRRRVECWMSGGVSRNAHQTPERSSERTHAGERPVVTHASPSLPVRALPGRVFEPRHPVAAAPTRIFFCRALSPRVLACHRSSVGTCRRAGSPPPPRIARVAQCRRSFQNHWGAPWLKRSDCPDRLSPAGGPTLVMKDPIRRVGEQKSVPLPEGRTG